MKKTVLEKSETWKKDLDLINELIKDGFIHVTGLSSKLTKEEPIVIKSDWNQFNHGEKGSMCSNNGMTAAITPEGFYFLKFGICTIFEKISEKVSKNDVGVYCSNGDTILSQALFRRVSNPLDEYHGDPFYAI